VEQPRAQVYDLQTQQQFSDAQLVNVHLWDGEGFYGRLVCMKRGQVVPEHLHEHKDESFDIIRGEGTFLLNGERIVARPGMTIYVPAGTYHALKADRSEYWVLRETVNERIYARRALKLLWFALLKRLRKRLSYPSR